MHKNHRNQSLEVSKGKVLPPSYTSWMAWMVLTHLTEIPIEPENRPFPSNGVENIRIGCCAQNRPIVFSVDPQSIIHPCPQALSALAREPFAAVWVCPVFWHFWRFAANFCHLPGFVTTVSVAWHLWIFISPEVTSPTEGPFMMNHPRPGLMEN